MDHGDGDLVATLRDRARAYHEASGDDFRVPSLFKERWREGVSLIAFSFFTCDHESADSVLETVARHMAWDTLRPDVSGGSDGPVIPYVAWGRRDTACEHEWRIVALFAVFGCWVPGITVSPDTISDDGSVWKHTLLDYVLRVRHMVMCEQCRILDEERMGWPSLGCRGRRTGGLRMTEVKTESDLNVLMQRCDLGDHNPLRYDSGHVLSIQRMKSMLRAWNSL